MKIQLVFRNKGFDIILDKGIHRLFMICSYLPGDWVLPQVKRESATMGVGKCLYLFIAAFCFAYERFSPRSRTIVVSHPNGRVEEV